MWVLNELLRSVPFSQLKCLWGRKELSAAFVSDVHILLLVFFLSKSKAKYCSGGHPCLYVCLLSNLPFTNNCLGG